MSKSRSGSETRATYFRSTPLVRNVILHPPDCCISPTDTRRLWRECILTHHCNPLRRHQRTDFCLARIHPLYLCIGLKGAMEGGRNEMERMGESLNEEALEEEWIMRQGEEEDAPDSPAGERLHWLEVIISMSPEAARLRSHAHGPMCSSTTKGRLHQKDSTGFSLPPLGCCVFRTSQHQHE